MRRNAGAVEYSRLRFLKTKNNFKGSWWDLQVVLFFVFVCLFVLRFLFLPDCRLRWIWFYIKDLSTTIYFFEHSVSINYQFTQHSLLSLAQEPGSLDWLHIEVWVSALNFPSSKCAEIHVLKFNHPKYIHRKGKERIKDISFVFLGFLEN